MASLGRQRFALLGVTLLALTVALLAIAVNAVAGHPDRHAASSSPAPAGPGPRTIMIIRHGEKPDGDGLHGIDDNGRRSGGSLTELGWQRAKALAELFDPSDSQPLRPGLARPTALYAARPDGKDAQRPRQTITPLAQRLGLPVVTSYAKGDEVSLIRDIMSRPGIVLICWQHDRIDNLARQLGAARPSPPRTWPPERFDLIWVFNRDGSGPWAFQQVPQQLLPSDRTDPVE